MFYKELVVEEASKVEGGGDWLNRIRNGYARRRKRC